MSAGQDRGVLIAGTGSNVGKSLIVTGLLRWCMRNGIDAAPFKGQNMALNSAVSVEGGEVARAQAVQARAAGVDLSVAMNPVLIKPTAAQHSQLIVNGFPVGEITSGDWIAAKRDLLATVVQSYESLLERHELVIAEGAGSAAEINLLDGDLANLRFAQAVGLGTVLVGDLEPGGVFASIWGHYTILDESYRRLLRGFILNRVRGDGAILESGIQRLTHGLATRWFGNLPLVDGYLPGEDAINVGATAGGTIKDGAVRIRVVEVPYLANYTDFDPLILEPDIDLRFVQSPSELDDADLVVLPGTKATLLALDWLVARGFAQGLDAVLMRGGWLLGVCGGYQMLARTIVDQVESGRGEVQGLGLVDAIVSFEAKKVLANVTGTASAFGDAVLTGYQIHHGRVLTREKPLLTLEIPSSSNRTGAGGTGLPEGASQGGQVYGTTVHGLFDADEFRAAFCEALAQARGREFRSQLLFSAYLESSLDHLAEVLETSLDVPGLLGLDRLGN